MMTIGKIRPTLFEKTIFVIPSSTASVICSPFKSELDSNSPLLNFLIASAASHDIISTFSSSTPPKIELWSLQCLEVQVSTKVYGSKDLSAEYSDLSIVDLIRVN